MCLRWGTTLQIVLKKAGVDKDAIRSLKPNDSALRERGRPIFFSKQNSWQSLLLPDEIRWVTAGCSVTKRGKTSVWWHLGGWWGSAGTRGWQAALGGGHWEEQAIAYLGRSAREEGKRRKSKSQSAIRRAVALPQKFGWPSSPRQGHRSTFLCPRASLPPQPQQPGGAGTRRGLRQGAARLWVWLVCLLFPFGRPQLLLPALRWSSLKPAVGETTRGDHEGGWMPCTWEPLEEQVPLKYSRKAALCYAHRCAPVILYVKPSRVIVPSSLLSFFSLMSHREGWYLSFTERKPAAKSKASKRHHRASGAAKNRFKHISVRASYKHQLILLLVLYRLNKKFNVQVAVQANFVVSNVVMGSNYCFCGKKKWKWVDFNFFPVTSLWTLWVSCIIPRIFLSSLLKFSLSSKL